MAKTVLLIEDEQNIIEAISFVLTRAGWNVRTHTDGATAHTAIRDAEPAVVMLDVMLPNRSGFDILRDLRSDPETKDIPVLMLTAKGQAKDRELAESFGVSHFMTKPFSNQEVVERISALAE